MAEKILVFRRGSLGDGVVSLPALHALAERFPGSDIRILTNTPISSQAAPLQNFLNGTGLVQGFFTFPPSGRSLAMWNTLAHEIRRWGPDRLVYLSEPSGWTGLAREVVFFLACGIRRFTGLPIGPALRTYRRLDERLWESESGRLLRATGASALPADAWDARFSPAEEAEAKALLGDWPGASRFIVICAGGKLADQDWGDSNWRTALDGIAQCDSGFGLLAVGAIEETERAERLMADWPGPVLNLCGKAGPRIIALAMRKGLFYFGHDSGPMHLAALVGLPCVTPFNARAKPGVWFPHGNNHHVFYPWELAETVPATAGFRTGGTTIRTNAAGPVAAACRELIIGSRDAP